MSVIPYPKEEKRIHGDPYYSWGNKRNPCTDKQRDLIYDINRIYDLDIDPDSLSSKEAYKIIQEYHPRA